jgi:hypothetical protein
VVSATDSHNDIYTVLKLRRYENDRIMQIWNTYCSLLEVLSTLSSLEMDRRQLNGWRGYVASDDINVWIHSVNSK